jgi:hypothetical protein
VKNAAIPTTAKAVQPGMGTSGRRVFPRQSGGDGRNAYDEREADRCSLGADRTNVTGSSSRWLTTHNRTTNIRAVLNAAQIPVGAVEVILGSAKDETLQGYRRSSCAVCFSRLSDG